MNDSLIKTQRNFYVSIDDACQTGNLDIVVEIFKKGYNSQIHQHKAFKKAASYGHLHIIRYFLENNHAPISADNYHVYRWNVEYNQLHILAYLNEHYGIPEEIKTELLLEAVKSGHMEVLEFIWEHGGFNRDSFKEWRTIQHVYDNNNPFIEAVFYKHYDMVNFFIQQGEHYDCCDHEALKFSTQLNHIEMLEFLVREYYLPHQQTSIAIDLISKSSPQVGLEMSHYLEKLLLTQQLQTTLNENTTLPQSKI